jgi:drug/metabolite transporter (DMT)-like permease
VVDTPYLPAESRQFARRPAIGYATVVSAAVLFGVNGAVSKVALEAGLSSFRLAQARCLGAVLILVPILLATRPSSLRAGRRELPLLVAYGCGGIVVAQITYFLA